MCIRDRCSRRTADCSDQSQKGGDSPHVFPLSSPLCASQMHYSQFTQLSITSKPINEVNQNIHDTRIVVHLQPWNALTRPIVVSHQRKQILRHRNQTGASLLT